MLFNLICTDVMVQKVHYIYLVNLIMAEMLLCSCIYLVFSSGMVNRNLFQMCGRLYLPMFLFRVGLLTVMYMASLMALAIF